MLLTDGLPEITKNLKYPQSFVNLWGYFHIQFTYVFIK